MYIVRRLSDGQYMTRSRWIPDIQQAKVWPTKNGPSSYCWHTDYSQKGPDGCYLRVQYAEIVEVHIVLGPDPSAPSPIAKLSKKKAKAQETSPDVIPDYWQDIVGLKDDTDTSA